MVEVTCECGHVFAAAESHVGGIVNCPSCRRATSVPGLRDGLWRVAQIAAAIGFAVVVALAYVAGGVTAALVVAVIAGAVIALVTLAM